MSEVKSPLAVWGGSATFRGQEYDGEVLFKFDVGGGTAGVAGAGIEISYDLEKGIVIDVQKVTGGYFTETGVTFHLLNGWSTHNFQGGGIIQTLAPGVHLETSSGVDTTYTKPWGAEPTINVTGKASTSIGGVIVSAVASTEEVVPIDFGTEVTFEPDGIYDPIGSAIAGLHEQYPNIPIEELEDRYLAALSEHEEVYAAGTSRPPEAGVAQLADPAFSTNAALLESLEASDKYHAYITRHDPGSTEEPPTGGNSGGGSGGGGGNDDHDDPTVDPVTTPTPDPVDVTAPAPGVAWKDPSTGRTHVQDGPNHHGNGTQAPVLLDLDGDGIEVVFGEDIYFDTDGDGFVEKTAWAAADDGFYKEVA